LQLHTKNEDQPTHLKLEAHEINCPTIGPINVYVQVSRTVFIGTTVMGCW